MTKKAKQPYQYEPLVTPSTWKGDEQRFSVRLTQIIDDLYQKFSALRQKSVEPVDAKTLDGKQATEYALKTDTAPNAQKLGGKGPEYYLQPKNWFENSYFIAPVAQAGFNGKHGNDTYIIDRWKHLFELGTATQTANGITISGADFYMQQKIDVTNLLGKQLTMAVGLSNGNVVCGSYLFDSTEAKVFREVDGLCLMFAFGGFAIRLYSNVEKTITWAALYEGEYTSDTLPPYVPKGYVAELAECRMYYKPFKSFWAFGHRVQGAGYIIVESLGHMRVTPSVITGATVTSYNSESDWVETPVEMVVVGEDRYWIALRDIAYLGNTTVLVNGILALCADL